MYTNKYIYRYKTICIFIIYRYNYNYNYTYNSTYIKKSLYHCTMSRGWKKHGELFQSQWGPPRGHLWPSRVRRCRPPLGGCSGQSPAGRRRCDAANSQLFGKKNKKQTSDHVVFKIARCFQDCSFLLKQKTILN